jgi:hypothetical protein
MTISSTNAGKYIKRAFLAVYALTILLTPEARFFADRDGTVLFFSLLHDNGIPL